MNFTEQLRAIDDAGFDVYQYRIMMHVWRVGECWESVRTMAGKCSMSVGKVSAVVNQLLEDGHLFRTVTKDGRVALTICSPHEQTQQLKRSPREQRSYNEQRRSPHEQAKLSPPLERRSPHELKINEPNEDNNNNDPVHMVSEHFTAITGISPNPGNWDRNWESPIKFWLNGAGDYKSVNERMTKAIDIARGNNEAGKVYRVVSPNSLSSIMGNLEAENGASKKGNGFNELWDDLTRKMSSHGADRKPQLSPEVEGMVHKAGGWPALCRMDLKLAQTKLRSIYDGSR